MTPRATSPPRCCVRSRHPSGPRSRRTADRARARACRTSSTSASPSSCTVHEGFDFWAAEGVELGEDAAESLERMNETVVPTRRLTSVEGAYWARMGEREYLRWAVPQDEQLFVDGLARLHARREAGLGEGGRLGKFIGAFRSCGVLVPVWDLPPGTEAEDIETPVAELSARLDAAFAVDAPLTADERRARAGLVARQLTLR